MVNKDVIRPIKPRMSKVIDIKAEGLLEAWFDWENEPGCDSDGAVVF